MRMECGFLLAEDELLRIENHALVAIAEIVNQSSKTFNNRRNRYGLHFLKLHLKQSQGGFVSTAV